MLTKESLLRKVFSDPKNYPYGFSRSGDFSIAESKALTEYGCLIAALVDGDIDPQTDDDKAIIAAAHGLDEAQDTMQRAWLKYQKRINRPKAGNIHGSVKARYESVDDEELLRDIDDVIVEVEDEKAM